jgi:hypothetical protein
MIFFVLLWQEAHALQLTESELGVVAAVWLDMVYDRSGRDAASREAHRTQWLFA